MANTSIPRVGSKTAPVANVNLYGALAKVGVPYNNIGHTLRKMLREGWIDGNNHRIVPGRVGIGNGATVSRNTVDQVVFYHREHYAAQLEKYTALWESVTKSAKVVKRMKL